MPDVHAGAGCTIGTTMTIKDKIVPNLVGVDIGCGMETLIIHKDSEASKNFNPAVLDTIIRKNIPCGYDVRKFTHKYVDEVEWDNIKGQYSKNRARLSLGTLGGGNHFIEADRDTDGNLYIVVHSGSRHAGLEIAEYYQEMAWRQLNGKTKADMDAMIAELKAAGRQNEIEEKRQELNKKCTVLQNITIPESVQEIRASAFFKCSKLEEIIIPANVTVIGKYAFNECELLKTLTIPSGVTKIEKAIVEDCTALETLIIPSSITEVVDNPFKGCKALKSVAVEGESVISSDVVKQLNEYAEKNFGKDKVKIKSGAAAAIAKNLGAGLGSMLGDLGKQLKGNEQVSETLDKTKEAFSKTKDAFGKALGGLFKKK